MTQLAKGDISSAEVVYVDILAFNVRTEWAVRLHFQSPTGDASDFLAYDMPCATFNQACEIADRYNSVVAPYLCGKFKDRYQLGLV
jgi:hypothetical protein